MGFATLHFLCRVKVQFQYDGETAGQRRKGLIAPHAEKEVSGSNLFGPADSCGNGKLSCFALQKVRPQGVPDSFSATPN